MSRGRAASSVTLENGESLCNAERDKEVLSRIRLLLLKAVLASKCAIGITLEEKLTVSAP